MAQQSKIELLLDLKDRLSAGISKAKQNVTRSTDETLEKLKRRVAEKYFDKHLILHTNFIQ